MSTRGERRPMMYMVIRRYEGADQLADALVARRPEVEALISGVPGFGSYQALRSGSTLVTITVAADQAGTQESSRRAAGWVQESVPGLDLTPVITEGEVILDF